MKIIFDAELTHLYSTGLRDDEIDTVPKPELVVRNFPRRDEVRRFSLERARLLDRVLPAISLFVVSTPDAGGRPGFEKRILYGPPLPSGGAMRVVLRQGSVKTEWHCVSAYPVSASEVAAARRLKRAKFPP